MSRHSAMATIGFLLFASPAAFAQTETDSRPNIVLIVADDNAEVAPAVL